MYNNVSTNTLICFPLLHYPAMLTMSCDAVVYFQFPEVIPLNVGGTHFTTRLSTLRRYEDTMLAAMFSGRHHIPRDAEGRFFIDRDGKYFGWECGVTFIMRCHTP